MEVTSSTATWPVVRGALGSCLSVESSSCPLDQSFAVSAPLILRRPCPDDPHYAPCDITVVFPEKHEIRQIYVRSTARIYEIYYAPNSTSPNEYLCTVFCSPVQLSPHDADGSEAIKESDSHFSTETSSRSSNISNSEDGWVDIIKSFDSNISKISVSPPRNEDLYEATAEISDVDPCVSLTLRLLSIQSKGYVCVDEIYVFGDPVGDDNDDTGNQNNSVGSAAGSSLMALLAPTLLRLQLSKSGIGRTLNKCNNKQPKDQSSHYIGSQEADLITATHENLPELRPLLSSQQAATCRAGSVPAYAPEPEKSHVSIRIPDEAVNPNFTTKEHPSHVEKSLNELISRLIKIEDMCSGFLENVRKPICSIEERLSRVEQQLSVLAKNSQNSKISPGTRFYAPDWSCMESASNSSDTDESNPSCGTGNTLDIPSLSLPAQPLGSVSSILMDATEVLPSLLSGAPQYANHDAEDADPPILVNVTSSEQPKKTLSIDDALASALAAFTYTAHPQTLTSAFSIKAPEYSTSEASENNNIHSSVSRSAQITSCIIHEDETEVTGCEECSTSISTNVVQEVQELLDNDTCSYQIKEQYEGSASSKFEGISQFMNCEDPQVEEHNESNSSNDFEGDVQYVNDEDVHDVDKHVSNESNKDSANIEYTSEEEAHSSDSEVDHQQKARNDREVSNQKALLQVIELARMPSPVNFDTSILDVIFISGEVFSANSSPLEALLTDTTAGYQVEAPHDAEVGSGGDATRDHDFIPVEKDISCLATTDSTVNMHHYDLETASMVMENKLMENEAAKDLHTHFNLKLMENEAAKDLHTHFNHEVFPASLI